LTGSVELREIPPAKRTVRLRFAEEGLLDGAPFGLPSSDASGSVAPDGSFRITDFQPGKFRSVVDPLPENAYVSSVELDGSIATNGIIELSAVARAPHLKIAIALDGANISGRILNAEGELTQGQPPVFLLANPSLEGGTVVEAKAGTYEFKGVRPGKYRLILLSFAQIAANNDNAQREENVRKAFEAAEEIEIGPRARVAKDLHEK
jgi:hypothetical protein